MKPFIVGTSISAASQILCLKKRELSTDLYLIKDFKLERESYAAYLIREINSKGRHHLSRKKYPLQSECLEEYTRDSLSHLNMKP